jgi:DNA-binding NarL/FixJ family response regulator/signal transduction histidine kinase
MGGATAAWWWRRFIPPARDAALALAVTVALLYGAYGEAHPSTTAYFHGGHHLPRTPTAALILVGVACLVLAWRRRWPVAVLGVSVAAATIYTLLGYLNGAALVAPMGALYTVAALTSIRRAVGYGIATLVVLGSASIAVNPLGPFGGGVVILPFMVAVVVVAGIAVANRRAYVDSIRDRAEQDARRRLDEERLRIARELHDVVAHTMATINVQAGVAAHVLPTRPEAAAESLQAIKTASKEGLRELRAILNVLRQADDADPTQPAPGTAQLEDLIAGARRSGLETTLTVTGDPVPLPAAVDLAAYRIIQESLTNTIRHAGPAAAVVALGYAGHELRIDVTDTGRGQAVIAGNGDGHGLAGMRERAAAVGGTVEAGPEPAGGFRVAARLPLTSTVTEQTLIRAGFHVRIDAADDLEVVGEATDGAQAVDLARRQCADVVLMDIRMPGVDGLEATRRISADDDLAGVKVIILTTFESDEYVYQAIRAGASGFLVKDTEPADLLQAVRVVARGDALLSPSVTRRLITDLATRPERPPPSDRVLAGLTEREREVLALVAEGLSNDEIAGRLFLSPLTAKTHVSRIMTKLNARDRAQLVVIAYESGLVTPGGRR